MLRLVLLLAVILIFTIGFLLSLQAAQEAKQEGDLSRRLPFYRMSAIVALVGGHGGDDDVWEGMSRFSSPKARSPGSRSRVGK